MAAHRESRPRWREECEPHGCQSGWTLACLCRGASSALKLLAISGSLREDSSNTRVLRALGLLALPPLSLEPYEGIGQLPFFTPDHDRDIGDPLLPAVVQSLRDAVGSAEGLVISSPEYAHGVPGVLKNALDWLVGGPEMVGRPVLLINTSPHSVHAIASLAETLRTMSGRLLPHSPLLVPVRRGASLAEMLADAAFVDAVRPVLEPASWG